jgi:ferric-dicitrate binding protein FerR (iron transport regulator)
MDYQLFNKYLRGETSETEVAEIFQWIDTAPENKKEFVGYKKTWVLTAQGKEDETYTWRFVFAPFFRKQSILKSYLRIASYAAILLVVFGTGIAVQYIGYGIDQAKLVYKKRTSISAPLGQMTNVELPDGTKVMLNSGSLLIYNEDFALGKRTISLNGEAYFDVTKDKANPFMIQTSLLNFKVYGTSFNIEAYADENLVNTTLITGSLGVMTKDDKELLLLAPGQNAHFDTNHHKVVVSKVNTEIYTSWKEGLITFRNEKLKDIARKIERWYNVKIVINNERLGEEAYFGTIMKNKPIDQILEVLKLTSSLKYKITTTPDKPTLIYWY